MKFYLSKAERELLQAKHAQTVGWLNQAQRIAINSLYQDVRILVSEGRTEPIPEVLTKLDLEAGTVEFTDPTDQEEPHEAQDQPAAAVEAQQPAVEG